MTRIVTAIASIACLAGFMLVSNMDYQDALKQQSDYCQSVDDWNRTGGKAGHPDYDGNAMEICR